MRRDVQELLADVHRTRDQARFLHETAHELCQFREEQRHMKVSERNVAIQERRGRLYEASARSRLQ